MCCECDSRSIIVWGSPSLVGELNVIFEASWYGDLPALLVRRM